MFLGLGYWNSVSLDYVYRSDLTNRDIMDIPVGTRIAAAFVQSAAVRAAGFAIVPLASLAPAVKVLYVVMMVCPSHSCDSYADMVVHLHLPHRPLCPIYQCLRREIPWSIRRGGRE
jgi:hypothetical protein